MTNDDDEDLSAEDIADIEEGLASLRRNDIYVWDAQRRQFTRPPGWEGLRPDDVKEQHE